MTGLLSSQALRAMFKIKTPRRTWGHFFVLGGAPGIHLELTVAWDKTMTSGPCAFPV